MPCNPKRGLKAGSVARTAACAGGIPAAIKPRAPAPTKSKFENISVLT